MHVVVIADYASPVGGAEKVAIDSAVGLAGRGHQVHFLAAMGPVDARLAPAGVQVHLADVADLKAKGMLALVREGLWSTRCAALARQVLSALPAGQTVVHLHTWQRGLTAAVLREVGQGAHPLVLTLHDFGAACPNQGFFDYQRREICTRVALGADCLTTHCDTRTYAHKLWRAGRIAVQRGGARFPSSVSDVIFLSDLSRQFMERYFPASTRWHGVANPITVEPQPRAEAERNRPFLFVGRVVPEKGAELFARAVRRAGVPAIVVGDGTDKEQLAAAYPEIEFRGWQDQAGVRAAMRQARALVFASLWMETLGMTAQEALANGVPVIVADRTAAREAVQHGRNGLWFRHMDEEDLALKMQTLAASDNDARSMSLNAFDDYWKDPPTVERHLDALARLYAGALGRPA